MGSDFLNRHLATGNAAKFVAGQAGVAPMYVPRERAMRLAGFFQTGSRPETVCIGRQW